MDGNKNLRQFLNESSLLFRGQLQVPVSLRLRSQGCENFSAHPKIRRAHV